MSLEVVANPRYLLKFFEKEEFMNDFLNGKLYMNTMKFFKEKASDKNRLDELESIHKNTKLKGIEIGKHFLHMDDFLPFTTEKFDLCNIYCLYKFWQDDINKNIFIDEENKDFGKYCVLIYDIEKFLNRFEVAAKDEGFSYITDEIKYIEDREEFENVEESLIPFTKFSRYSYQKEFRLVMDTKNDIDKPYELEIGNLNDISLVTSIDEINNELKRIASKKYIVSS